MAGKSLPVTARRGIVGYRRLIWPGYRDPSRRVLVRPRCPRPRVGWRLRRNPWRLGYRYPENRWAQLDPDAIAPGIPPDASADLVFHGGKTVPQMEFQNVFLGGQASWLASDIDSINTAITLAMQDRRLNNVVGQFFDRGVKLTCDPRPLLVLEEAKPVQLDEPGVQRLVQQLVQ